MCPLGASYERLLFLRAGPPGSPGSQRCSQGSGGEVGVISEVCRVCRWLVWPRVNFQSTGLSGLLKQPLTTPKRGRTEVVPGCPLYFFCQTCESDSLGLQGPAFHGDAAVLPEGHRLGQVWEVHAAGHQRGKALCLRRRGCSGGSFRQRYLA